MTTASCWQPFIVQGQCLVGTLVEKKSCGNYRLVNDFKFAPGKPNRRLLQHHGNCHATKLYHLAPIYPYSISCCSSRSRKCMYLVKKFAFFILYVVEVGRIKRHVSTFSSKSERP